VTATASAVPAAGAGPASNPADLNGQSVSADGVAEEGAPGSAGAAQSTGGQRSGRAGRTVLAVAASKQYHRAGCELVADEGASAAELTKVAAIRQGYLACSVCRP
jgi:hypothetical protein